MIEVRNLSKSYSGNDALKSLSFKVPKGSVFGLLGENGAGKSTAMSIISGCLAPDSGTVLIDGADIIDEPKKAKRLIGYMPENPPLYPEMTPLEFLLFVAEAKGITEEDTDDRLKKVINKTGLKPVLHRLNSKLSKGFRQRVSLAAALLGEPEVLILDEPTSGLDPKQVVETRELISEYAQNHTVIISSHIISEIEQICDRVLILSNGTKAAEDTPENLKTSVKRVDMILKGEKTKIDAVLNKLPSRLKTSLRAHPDGYALRVDFSGEDPREILYKSFKDTDVTILGMSLCKTSLEDVFLKLTGEEDAE
ncbi:MAG: ABC transporter ATP-binding protein [Clostridia bacterium]|nr:ABC transporter ATP-binding protein [Clostridia bacterium]